MNRKDFLGLMKVSIKLNIITNNDEDKRKLSAIHGSIIEALLSNEHLDMFDIENTMKDEAMVYIIDKTNEDLVYKLLKITGEIYLKNIEEGECLIWKLF